MHPAPSLADILLKSDDPRDLPPQPPPLQQQQQQQEHQQLDYPLDQHPRQDQIGLAQAAEIHSPARLRSPVPVRKDTGSSTSTIETDATVTTNASNDSSSTVYSAESSQSIFSVKDGADLSGSRRASRRRTGPLSAAQREKAALIRKLGACGDCRRRRVACHPNHHNMTWEDAIRKYQRAHSPMHELAPLMGRPISPSSTHLRHGYIPNPQDMDIDSTPTPPATHSTPGRRTPMSESRIRTPLPLGPRLERPISMPPLAAAPPPPSLPTLPNIDFVKSEIDTAASRYFSGPHTGRYSAVEALLICWQDEESPDVLTTVEALGAIFEEYSFSVKILRIPLSSSEVCKNSQRWLSREINDFTDDRDIRDVLKIVYYNGCTFLDDGEMVLASPLDPEKSSIIRWSGIQEFFEGARSDTLILFDAVYHACSKMNRRKGVLELVAASASEEHLHLLGRNSFTRAVIQQLRSRATQRLSDSLSAAELHTKLVSAYPRIVQEKHSESRLLNVPIPLHLQMSGNSKLPSITLYPLHAGRPRTPNYSLDAPGGYQLTLSIRLNDENVDTERWTEWLRMMPDGIRDVKVVGPYSTFR